MLAKTTVMAGALILGMVSAALAQTNPATPSYEPSGTFQALWGAAPAASAPQAVPSANARRAHAQQIRHPSGKQMRHKGASRH